jgi:tetratricopeptide repeat protein
LAKLYQAQGRDFDAEPLFKRALAMREKALGIEHPDTKEVRRNLQTLGQSTDVPAEVSRYGQSGTSDRR